MMFSPPQNRGRGRHLHPLRQNRGRGRHLHPLRQPTSLRSHPPCQNPSPTPSAQSPGYSNCENISRSSYKNTKRRTFWPSYAYTKLDSYHLRVNGEPLGLWMEKLLMGHLTRSLMVQPFGPKFVLPPFYAGTLLIDA